MIRFGDKWRDLICWFLVSMILLSGGASTFAATGYEETFPLLKIGTTTYTNVTVTTKAKAYVFILHSSGMANIRVADLPPEVSQLLGYAELKKKDQATTAAATEWARKALAKFETPQVMAMEKGWRSRSAEQIKQVLPINKNTFPTILGVMLGLYLFFCYCSMLICRKAGHPGGVLVWLPILQIFPMFRAAGMSPLWFLALFVPGLNFVPQILLCFRLAKARGKSAWVGFFLVLPLTSVFAFLYLAFSSGADVEEAPVVRRRSTGSVSFRTT